MTAVTRSKENDCDFPLFKTPRCTPMHTPIRNGLLSSFTLNDRNLSSNNIKHLKFTNTININDLQTYNNTMTTPIRLNKNKYSTPGSNQNRRALGLVHNNSNKTCDISSSDDLSMPNISKDLNNKHDESIILQAPTPKITCPISEDDLPHESHNTHYYEDTFDDLIPATERIERMVINQTNGVNIFTYYGGIENTIRCQSPQSSRVDVSTLLDILD